MVSERMRRLGSRPQKLWRRISTSNWFGKIVAWKFSIPLAVLVSFFILSFGSVGPAYMSDEVAYLDKAATIAGSTVHLSTSWFGGYSLMIAPAFVISSDPFVAWKIILGLNAVMWAGTAMLLQYVLRKTHPKASSQAIFLATAGAMLYPSWLSMSGYAFSTSGFVLVFMGALAALLKSDFKHLGWLSIAGLLAGYLGWIHPLGFLMTGLFAALLLALSILRKRIALTAIGVGSLLFGASYVLVVHPWFNSVMGGSMGESGHYSEGIANLSSAIMTGQYWINVLGLFIGLLFFTVVATFGLVLYGAAPTVKRLLATRHSWKQSLQDPAQAVMLLPILSILGVIGITMLTWGASEYLRIDQWVYGRYTDTYLLPLIGFGLLASWRIKPALITAGAVMTGGLVLMLVTNPENTAFIFNNKVNLQGLWPMHLASVLHANTYWVWAALGAVGIAVVGLMGTANRKVFLPLMLLPIMLTGASNYIYRQTITEQHASVSSLYYYIKDNYSRTDCIGFTPVQDSHERFNLYSYYLHGYNIKMMTPEQWQAQKCVGPYLTYDGSMATADGLQIADTEARTGLHLVTRNNALATIPDPM